MTEEIAPSAPARPRRPVSLALGVGVFLLPVVFIWFLFRRGYSARAQIVGCVWMGVVGAGLLLSAPNGPLTKAPRPVRVIAPLPMTTTILDAPGGSPLLVLKLGNTQAAQRLLRTSVTLTNKTGSDLKYAEVLCLFYDADGRLLGSGLGNWARIEMDQVVTGEVVASNIELGAIRRRECRARSLKA